MKGILLCVALAAAGHAVYQVGQKSLPAAANPMLLLVGVYSVALPLAALAAPFFPTPEGVALRAQVFNAPVLVLGAGVLAIELGFLFLYRRGAGLQWAGIAVTGLSALVLIPIGIAWFREGFSPGRLLGMGLTLAGLALMVRR